MMIDMKFVGIVTKNIFLKRCNRFMIFFYYLTRIFFCSNIINKMHKPSARIFLYMF